MEDPGPRDKGLLFIAEALPRYQLNAEPALLSEAGVCQAGFTIGSRIPE
jgi:hypothetical protein